MADGLSPLKRPLCTILDLILPQSEGLSIRSEIPALHAGPERSNGGRLTSSRVDEKRRASPLPTPHGPIYNAKTE